MRNQSLLKKGVVFLFTAATIGSFTAPALAQGSGGSRGGWGGEKYQKRTSERFDLISYLADQKRIRSAQDAKLVRGPGGLWFTPDFVLTYGRHQAGLKREGAELGEATSHHGRAQLLLNGFIAVGNKSRQLNLDLGAEGFYGATSAFKETGASGQTQWQARESGGGMVIRPFGRSSQDTSLLLKGGYLKLTEKGLWANDATEHKLSGTYLGAEARLYLLPFLGARADYMSVLSPKSDALGGNWEMQRFKYGAFLEIVMLQVEAYLVTTDYHLKPSGGGAKVTDTDKGAGFGASLFF